MLNDRNTETYTYKTRQVWNSFNTLVPMEFLFVASRVCTRRHGIYSFEMSWENLTQIKDGKLNYKNKVFIVRKDIINFPPTQKIMSDFFFKRSIQDVITKTHDNTIVSTN